MIENPEHGLIFGELDLIGYDHTGPFWFETSADGTDWGNPEQLTRTITAFLQDGAIQIVDGYGNRTMPLHIMVRGEDSEALAMGEAALMAEAAKGRNQLTWIPPNKITGSGTPSVFDVVSSDLQRGELDDIEELHQCRPYVLTITALPWARAQRMRTVVNEAPSSATPTVTSIDDCTATTGWTRTVGITGPTVVSGAVTASTNNPAAFPNWGGVGLRRSGLSVSMTSARYVRIDWSATGYGLMGAPIFEVLLNGVLVSESARNGTVAWYYCAASTLTSVEVKTSWRLASGGGLSQTVADISRSDMPNDALGQRQRFMQLAVAGSARSPGNLALESPSSALGTVLVYTAPATSTAQQPPLRALRTSGPGETTDLSLVSTKYSNLDTLNTFDIPADNVESGAYLLLARVRHATAGTHTLSWSARARMGSNDLPGVQAGTTSVTLAAGEWTTVVVGVATLPPRKLGGAGKVRLGLQSSAGVQWDEFWHFNAEVGRLTWVEAGTGSPAPGGAANRVWLDAASLQNPELSVWMGNAADRSDAYGASSFQSFGRHEFVPSATNVFLCTTGSTSTKVTLSHYPAGHTHMTDLT